MTSLTRAASSTDFANQLGDRWPLFNAALGRVFPGAEGIRREAQRADRRRPAAK